MDAHRPVMEEGPVARDQPSPEEPYAATTATRDRAQSSRLRDQAAHERDVIAGGRDASSTLRDQIADGRDRDAINLDASDDLADRDTLGVEELRGRGREGRRRAAGDRAEAGRDRELAIVDRHHASTDREHAGSDRERAAQDREDAGTDDLTGARRRGVGLEQLSTEMMRAHRESGGLIAAYVDVDGLKVVNDEQGHAAGDALLRTVADGFRRHMRPYDLFVRLGGDEFLCALPSITLLEARERFAPLLEELKEAGDWSVSIGYSEMRDADTADELVKRADGALLAHRRI
jgi:diguanylate cyclase (GGDEF)-like protein